MASYIYDSTDSYPFSSEDRGFTYTPATSTEDFGAVNISATSQESYDTITVVQGNDTPFGFSTVNGSAVYWKPKRYSYSSSSDNLYTSEDYGDIVLIEIYGTISESSSVTEDWGSLGTVTSSEDFGVVTSFTATTIDSSEDYGTIIVADNIITREDRYLIITNQSSLAMEPGYTTSTSGATYSFTANTPDNTQMFSISGALISKVVFTWVGSGNPFEIGGSANEIVKAFSTVGTSGPLRLDGTSTEVFTKSYSLDAVVPFDILDYGSVPTSPTLDVDFGLVSQAYFGGEKDFGLITNTQEVNPYGLYESDGVSTESFAKGLYTGQGTISLSGEVVLPLAVSIIGVGSILSNGFSIEKNTESYIASGSLFATSGAAEVFGANPLESTQAFITSGIATEKNTERYIGNAIITKDIISDSFEINTGSFVNVAVFNSGTGTGTTGGFNVGRHLKFGTTGSTGARRFDLIPLDVSGFSTISITGIKGNSANGGEEPDSGEDLQLQYSVNGGSTFILIGNIIAENDASFNVLNTVNITLPAGAKTSSTIFRILQPSTSGVTFDHYGVTQIQLSSAVAGNIVLSGGYTNLKFTSGGGETTQLFAISGSGVEKNTEDYVGTGESFIDVTSAEKNTEAYVSELASDFYEIAGAAVEKFIAQTPENTQIFIFSGAAVEKFTSQGGESTQIFTFTGNGVEKNTEDYIGEGTFSSFSGAAESVAYRYSFDSFVPFFEFDYGSVSQEPTNEINLGEVSAPNTGGEQDYGTITYDDTVFPYGLWTTSGTALDAFSKNIVDSGGSIILSGEVVLPLAVSIIGVGSILSNGFSIEKNTESYIASGSLFATSGAAEVFGANPLESTQAFITSGTAVEKFRANPPEDFALYTFSGVAIEKFISQGGETTQLFTLSGSAVEKNTEDYVGLGTTTFSGTKVEKNTESYFAPLPAFIFVNVDNGQIDDSAVNEDYGLITQAATEFENLQGLVLDYIKVSGFADESFVAQTPENTQLFTISGDHIEKFVVNPPETAVTFSYTGNAVEKNTEDYVGTGTATIDISSEVRRTPSYVGFGFAFTANGSAEAFGANPPENTQLFQISGVAVVKVNPKWIGEGTISVDVTSLEKHTEVYIGAGSLFSIVDGSEARTYVYDETTSVLFLELDYGSLTQSVDTINDFGQITNFFNEVDYGTVVYTESVFPFGSAFLSGSAAEAFSPNTPENTQIFIFSGAAVEKFTSGAGESTQLFSLSGAAVEKNTEDYVGTGVTTFSGVKVEKNTEVYIGTGSAAFAGIAVEKFRANPPEDFALYTFSGNAVEKFTSGAGESTQLFNLSGVVVEKNTESYVGTGSLFSIVDGSEARTYDYISEIGVYTTEVSGDISSAVDTTEDYGLIINGVTTTENWGSCLPDVIKLKGELVESFTEGVYDASGSIIISGTGKVREIPRWDGGGTITISGTGTVPLTFVIIGSGSLFSTSGAVESVGANPPEDFALFNVTGESVVRSTPRWIGSGAANIDVTHTMRFVPNWNGFGTIFIDATSVEKNTESYVASGVTTLSGVTVEKNTEVYIGTGSATFTGTKVEKFRANPPEDFALYTFSGVAVEKFTSGAGESTQLFNLSGAAVEKNTEDYIGTGSAFTFIDSDESVTFDYTSEIPEILHEYRNLINQATAATEDYGLISVAANEFDDFGVIARSYIKIIPTANVKATPRETGFGSLFTTGGQAEVFGVNPPENIQVFTYSGSATEKNTESYVGLGEVNLTGAAEKDLVKSFVGSGSVGNIGGSIFFIGYFPYTDYVNLVTSGAASYIEVNAFNGTGTTFVTGDAVDRNIDSYVGTGSLFGIGGGAEARVYDYGSDVVIGFNEVDYGFITETPTIDIDYSTIAIGEIGGNIDYGQIRFSETITSTTGLVEISGAVYVTTSPVYYGAGTFTISDTALERNTEAYTGLGSVSIDITSIEKNTESYVGTGSTVLTGDGVEKNTEVYIGVGSLFTVGGGAEKVRFNPPEDETGLFGVTGAATERNTEAYTGSGFISTFSGAVEVFGVNLPENTQFFIFSGAGNTREIAVYTAATSGSTTLSGSITEKNTESYVGVGSVSIDITSIEKNTEAYSGTGTSTLSGISVEKNTEVYIGTGSIVSLSGSSESFGANPPENTQLFVYTGASTEKNTESYVGVGSVSIDIVSTEKNTEAFVGTGSTVLTGAGVEKNTEVYIGTGSTSLSGVAETREIAVYTAVVSGDGKYVLFNTASSEISVRYWRGTGTVTLTGTAVEKNTEAFSGLGELFGFNGAAESRTINPEENTVLYTFVGAAVERNTEKWVGTGTTTLSGTKIEKNTESYVGTGTTTASGVGIEKNTEAYNGTGNLFIALGAAESVGVNLPESTVLFSYAGAAVERNIESYVGTGAETITGTVVESNTESYVGTGVLNSLSGAAEAYSAQTPENTVLFIFTGAGKESFIAQTPERTVLFKFTGFSIERNTEVHFGTGSTTLTGTAVEKNTEAYNGTGTLTASGVGLEVFSPVYIGSGGFINYSGGAESFGANPPEDISLFTVLGSATERNTEAHLATGGATVTGVAVEKNTEAYEGVGQLFSYFGAAESITVNPEENIVLFTIAGFAAESFSAQTPENTQLFEINGFSVERNTEAYDGSGTLTASGDAYTPLFKRYFGSGSVFAINGAAESFSVNPPEDTVLYNFVGAAAERNTEVYYGEEVIFIDVDSTESASRFYDGFGSFSTLSGGAESFGANPLENTQLFTYTGSASEKNTESYTGVGNIDIDIFAAENITESYIGSGTSTISGFADISQSDIVFASGSLFATSGAAEVFGVNLPESVILFTYNGTATEKNTAVFEGFVTIEITDSAIERNTESFEGSVTSTLSGISDSSATNTYIGEISLEFSGVGREEFVPGSYRGKGTATISGSSIESITEVFTASGSLFGFGGSAEASTNVANSNILATISGSAITTRTNIVLGDGILFAFNGSAKSISRNPDTQISIFVISGSSTTAINPYRPPKTYVSVI